MLETCKGGEDMTASTIIVTIVVAIIGSGALTTVVSVLINRHYAKKDKESEQEKTFRFVIEALAHNAYFGDSRKLIRKDSITEEELDNHNFLYKAYHSLGLNGTGDRIHEIILDKPVDPQ